MHTVTLWALFGLDAPLITINPVKSLTSAARGPDVDECGDWAEVHLLILSLKMSGPLWQHSDIWTAFKNVSECRGCCFRPRPFPMNFPMCYLKPLKSSAHTLRLLTSQRDLLHSLTKQGILIEWFNVNVEILIWRLFLMIIIWKPLVYINTASYLASRSDAIVFLDGWKLLAWNILFWWPWSDYNLFMRFFWFLCVNSHC